MALRDGLIRVDTVVDIELDDDEMAYVLDSLGLDDLPGVLDWRPAYLTSEELRRAHAHAASELRERGIVRDAGDVDPAVAQSIRTLALSQWDLEVRTVTRTPTGPVVGRRCLSAGLDGRVSAVRTPTGYRITTADGPSVVGKAEPLRFSGVSAPREVMVRALDRPAASTWSALGCDEQNATLLSEALSTNTIHVEIVLVGHRTAVPERVGTPIALFETPRGRVLATTSFAADGTAWSSLAPGTDGRIRTEIQALLDLF